MTKCIFIVGVLIFFSMFWPFQNTGCPTEDRNVCSNDTGIKKMELEDTISFKEYLLGLHHLTMSQAESYYLLLNRLIADKRSVLKDTSALIELSYTFPSELQGKNPKNDTTLPDSSSLNRFEPLLRQKICMLLWNDSVWKDLASYTDSSIIVVNIAANHLFYIHKGKIEFYLRTIAGKRSTPTPVFNSRVTAVVRFPYWNIPRRIAVNEILPIVSKQPALLQVLHLQVLEGTKVVSNPAILPWKSFSSNYFPYNLRQTPGPWNTLGLLKFEFINPYHVYLHDTNNKAAFQQDIRYLSHGCIRLEDPLKLATRIGARLGTIGSGNEGNLLRPVRFVVIPPIRIFVIYATVEMEKNRLKWFPDIYNKIKVEKSICREQLEFFNSNN